MLRLGSHYPCEGLYSASCHCRMERRFLEEIVMTGVLTGSTEILASQGAGLKGSDTKQGTAVSLLSVTSSLHSILVSPPFYLLIP